MYDLLAGQDKQLVAVYICVTRSQSVATNVQIGEKQAGRQEKTQAHHSGHGGHTHTGKGGLGCIAWELGSINKEFEIYSEHTDNNPKVMQTKTKINKK